MVRTLIGNVARFRFPAILALVVATAGAGFAATVARSSGATTCSPTMGSIITTTRSFNYLQVASMIDNSTQVVLHAGTPGVAYVPVSEYYATASAYNATPGAVYMNISSGFDAWAQGTNTPIYAHTVAQIYEANDANSFSFSGNISENTGLPVIIQFSKNDGADSPTGSGSVVISAQYRAFKTCQN